MTDIDRSSARRRPGGAYAIAAAVLVVDQTSKQWAASSLSPHERVPLLGDALGLRLHHNPGAAFSIGTGATWVFTLVAAVAVVVLAGLVLRPGPRAQRTALGLLLGGAATHLLDRLVRPPAFGHGHVVDFIAYGDWFVGNVADIAIVAGAVVVAWTVLRTPDGR